MSEDPKTPEPVAYLYHDADKPENAHPLFHSTMLVMPFGRREGGRNETPLITTTAAQAYAEALAAHRVAQAVAAKQAEIDRLMLEWCPNEMTREQLTEWAANQRSAPPDINAVLHANLGALYIEDTQPPETGKEN